jgi:hypothetical protein
MSFRHVRIACCDAPDCAAEGEVPRPPTTRLVPVGWTNVASRGAIPSRQYCPDHSELAAMVTSIRAIDTRPREDQE